MAELVSLVSLVALAELVVLGALVALVSLVALGVLVSVALVSAAEVVAGSEVDSALAEVTVDAGSVVASELAVALSWRLASLIRLAMTGSSPCRASAA